MIVLGPLTIPGPGRRREMSWREGGKEGARDSWPGRRSCGQAVGFPEKWEECVGGWAERDR